MLVQRVVMPASRRESWTVLGDDAVPIESVERYLAYLTDIERSPNTVKAYAHDLMDWFMFLASRCLDWREVRLEDVGEFVAWLRLPPEGRGGRVAVLPSVEHHCVETAVNQLVGEHQVRQLGLAVRGHPAVGPLPLQVVEVDPGLDAVREAADRHHAGARHRQHLLGA